MTSKRAWLVAVLPLLLPCFLLGGVLVGLWWALTFLYAEFNKEWDRPEWEDA